MIGPVRRIVLIALAAAMLAACDTGNGSPAPSPAPAENSPPSTGSPSPGPELSSESPSPEPLPSPVAAVRQGGKYFAVYLGVGAPGSGTLKKAEMRFADLGITAVAGDISCDRGAAESLGVEPGSFAVGVYFEKEPDAITFATALAAVGAVYGPVPVKTYCAD